jgi:hypothetical protein
VLNTAYTESDRFSIPDNPRRGCSYPAVPMYMSHDVAAWERAPLQLGGVLAAVPGNVPPWLRMYIQQHSE